MFLPTSSSLSRVSIIILRGDNSLPVWLAGQLDVHLPHSVQEYASINCFQLRSNTSFAPKRSGGASAAGAAAAALGSSISFISLVTDARLVNSPLGFRFE